jgi:exopolysaccharide biosynthesis polyprenyl glycosylphosphotransferase
VEVVMTAGNDGQTVLERDPTTRAAHHAGAVPPKGRLGWPTRARRSRAGVGKSGAPRAALRRDAIYRRSLALSDAVSAMVALLLCVAVLGEDQLEPASLLFIPLVIVVSKVSGLYDRDELLVHKTTLDEVPALFQFATLYTLLVWLLDAGVVDGHLGRAQVVGIWGALFVSLIVGRGLARRASRAVAASERCLVIGPHAAFERVSDLTEAMPGVEVVGYVPVHRGGRDLGRVVDDADVHRVIVAATSAEPEPVLDIVRTVKSLGVKVSVMPHALEAVGRSVEFDDIRGVPVLGVRRFGLTHSSALVKRAFDLVGAGLIVLVLLPLFAAIGLAIKLDSRGPVFFRQRRVGRDGRNFNMVKFRSMVSDAEKHKAALAPLNEAVGLFKIADDPRVTRVGRWLRRTSLDELPQLINVLRGEMSLVGPRPLVPEEDRRVQGWSRRRLHLTPGMTGQWQVLGGSRIPLDEMVAIDYLYIANWSLWSDVKILLRTLLYVVGGKGL